MCFSALRTKPANTGSLSFLSLGASKDEGLALALAVVNGATGWPLQAKVTGPKWWPWGRLGGGRCSQA